MVLAFTLVAVGDVNMMSTTTCLCLISDVGYDPSMAGPLCDF
jgi:hypothetical protein